MKIFNVHSKKGSSLIEILVVLAVFIIAGAILTQAFYFSLRGANKSEVLNRIKQNGQSILDSLDKTIRAADEVVATCSYGSNTWLSDSGTPLGNLTDTFIILKNGVFTRYRFLSPSSSQNGRIISQTVSLTTTSLNDNILLAEECTTDTSSGTETLTLNDIDPVTGVSVVPVLTNPSNFVTLNPRSGFKPTLSIQFRLRPAIQATAALVSQIEPVPFQTTIELR